MMQFQSQEFISSQPINANSYSKTITPDEIKAVPSIVSGFQVSRDQIVDSILNNHDENSISNLDDQSQQPREYSITFRINLLSDGHGQWRNIFHHGNSDSIRQPALWLYPSTNVLHCRCDSSGTPNNGFDSKGQVPLNVWTHVALVYYGPYQFLFLDGKLDSYAKLGAYLKRDDSQNFYLCHTGYGHSRPHAQLKNFRMYNVALCESDVIEDMNSDTPLLSSGRPSVNESKSESLLRRDLVKLMELKEFSNVHIVCSDSNEPIYANDAILIARSEYFKTLLSSQWNESTIFTPKDPFVLKVECEYQIMKRIVEYIYTGTISKESKQAISDDSIPLDMLLKLLQSGNQLMLTEMENLCTNQIIPKVTVENVCELYSIAHDANVESLSKYCKSFIVNMFKKIPAESIASLRVDLLTEVIVDLKRKL